MPFFVDLVKGNYLIKNRKVLVGMIVGRYSAVKKDGQPDYQRIEKHIRLAEECAVRLWNSGFAVFVPHLNTRHFEIKTRVPETVYQAFDQLMLRKIADFIFVLPNWRQSAGGCKEVKLAVSLGLPVFDKLLELKKWRDGNPDFKTVKL